MFLFSCFVNVIKVNEVILNSNSEECRETYRITWITLFVYYRETWQPLKFGVNFNAESTS